MEQNLQTRKWRRSTRRSNKFSRECESVGVGGFMCAATGAVCWRRPAVDVVIDWTNKIIRTNIHATVSTFP
jgi:hypothetical protein